MCLRKVCISIDLIFMTYIQESPMWLYLIYPCNVQTNFFCWNITYFCCFSKELRLLYEYIVNPQYFFKVSTISSILFTLRKENLQMYKNRANSLLSVKIKTFLYSEHTKFTNSIMWYTHLLCVCVYIYRLTFSTQMCLYFQI